MRFEVDPIIGLPEIEHGASLGRLIAETGNPASGAIVCISQKVVSKAEGRIRDLAAVEPSDRARSLAAELDKEPELVELVLGESVRVVRAAHGVLITETPGGLICANAGIDSSNVPGPRSVALLPEDCDRSAREIRREIESASGARVAVLITDSFGRPWRLGQSEVAIGCAGIDPLADWRGRDDTHGELLRATEIAVADQLAAAADLARDKISGTPAVTISGLQHLVTVDDGPGARALIRGAEKDLFR